MTTIPRLALFQPLESMTNLILPLFRKPFVYHIHNVTSAAELADFVTSQDDRFDALIVPSSLADKTSAVTACIQIRSQESLLGTPIIVLSATKDKAAISTFYGAGADIVMLGPFDADLLNFQINALRRMNLSLQEEQDVHARDRGLRQAMISALHFIDNALIILDTKPSIVFANQAAKSLFKIYESADEQERAKIYARIENIVGLHVALPSSSEIDSFVITPKATRIHNQLLPRCYAPEFRADLRLLPLTTEAGQVVAYCLSIDDVSTPRELSNALLQAERTQSLSLQFAAACMKLLGSASLGKPGRSLSRVEDCLAEEPAQCSLSNVMTSLLELIDIIVSTSAIIKVSIAKEITIAMKSSDLFQLLGNLILFSMRCSASQAETIISVVPQRNAQQTQLSIRSALPANATSRTDEKLLTAIRAQIIELTNAYSGSDNNRTILSFARAQQIADLYDVRISQTKLSELEVEFAVNLPTIS